MIVVLDSNVLFSALIKDAITRKIILEYEDLLLFPSYIFEELNNHKKSLIRKSGMAEKDFNVLLNLLLKKVLIVPEEVLLAQKEKALEIIKDIDKDDVLFIACALAYPNSVIWSDDKALKQQNIINVMNTREFIEILL